MTFAQLYGSQLDIELASADTVQLFTTARRKAAINEAVGAFVRATGCVVRFGVLTLLDTVGEYDLESEFSDFIDIDSDPSVKIINGSSTTYIQGLDLPRRTVSELDFDNPGWRAAAAGRPNVWYTQDSDSTTLLGLTPTPSVQAGETWTALVPYVALPPDLTNDTSLPFTIDGTPKRKLTVYHQGLVHFAAARLEGLRKNYAGTQRQMTLFNGYIAQYLEDKRSSGSDQLTLMRGYYDESKRQTRAVDWRTTP